MSAKDNQSAIYTSQYTLTPRFHITTPTDKALWTNTKTTANTNQYTIAHHIFANHSHTQNPA